MFMYVCISAIYFLIIFNQTYIFLKGYKFNDWISQVKKKKFPIIPVFTATRRKNATKRPPPKKKVIDDKLTCYWLKKKEA